MKVLNAIFMGTFSLVLMSAGCSESKKTSDSSQETSAKQETKPNTAAEPAMNGEIKLVKATVKKTVPGIQSNIRGTENYSITVDNLPSTTEKADLKVIADGYRLEVKRIAYGKDGETTARVVASRTIFDENYQGGDRPPPVTKKEYEVSANAIEGKVFLEITVDGNMMYTEPIELKRLDTLYAP